MQRLPGPLRFVPTLCGEVIGTIVFRRLLETSHLFADQPEVEHRLRALLGEVLSDEVSHVLYCRARLGPMPMRIARAVRPLLARGFLTIVPELRQLGLDRPTLMRRLGEAVELPRGLDAFGRLAQEPDPGRRLRGRSESVELLWMQSLVSSARADEG